MYEAAASGPLGALDSLQQIVALGFGTVLTIVVGRQMWRIWGAWSAYAEVANQRSHDDESRADQLQHDLTLAHAALGEANVKVARLEMTVEHQAAEIARLTAIIREVGPGPEN